MKNSCNNCTDVTAASKNGGLSVLSSLLVIIIPKCPWCIMAYSSAITVCGGEDMYMSENNWVSVLPIILSAAIIFLIYRNKRGIRTWVAMSLAVVSLLMIIGVHQTLIPSFNYELAAALQFFSIWLNGNLKSFIESIKSLFQKLNLSWRN